MKKTENYFNAKELIKFRENDALSESNLSVKKLRERSLIFTSTAIALALSACGRETRSTTEVPLADETSNIPTAFNDKLVGSDDIDTFTALAGDDEIYGFGGNDQIIAGTGNDTIYGGDGDDNIQPGAGDDKIGTSKGGGGGGKSGKDWTTLTRLLAPSSGLRASIAIDVENLLCAMF